MEAPRGTFSLDLSSDRQWRAFLAVLFGLTLLCRFLVHQNLEQHPVGRIDEWAGTEPWLTVHLAEKAFEDGDWLLRGPNLLLTREMAAWMPLPEWVRLADSRAPRGVPAVLLVAVSRTISGSLAIYTLLALLGGAALAVAAALAGDALFGSRPAGAVAGLTVALHGSLTLASVLPGPWMWEALGLGIILWLLPGLRSDQPVARWVLAGLAVALGIWLRPFFWWGALAAVAVAAAVRPSWRAAIGLLLPIVVAGGALSARNITVRAPATPSVGIPAWDFLETSNPAALRRPEFPADPTLFRAARARLPQTLRLAASDAGFRAATGSVLQRKLRELLGARDETWTFNPDYLRRRSEFLRTTTLPPDVTVPLGLASLVLLGWRRRLPGTLGVALGLVLVHGLLFRTSALERTLLHLCLCLATGGALAEVARGLGRRSAWPFLFLVLWAALQWLLAVDDQARGPRLRGNEFNQAARLYRAAGNERQARAELMDYRTVLRRDQVLTEFWNRQ